MSYNLEYFVNKYGDNIRKRFNKNIDDKEKLFSHFLNITAIVCDAAKIDLEKILGNKRGNFRNTDCRMVAMYYCYFLVKQNYSLIAEFFNRNHSTVIHAVYMIQGRIEVKDAAVTKLIADVNNKLSQIKGCKIRPHENEIQN